MITISLYLDARASKKDAPLKIALRKKGKTVFLQTDIRLLPEQWDKEKNKVINHPNRTFLNTFIAKRYCEVEEIVLGLEKSGKAANKTAPEIKAMIISASNADYKGNDDDLISKRFDKYIVEKEKERTKEIYAATVAAMKKYDKNYFSLRFEDITRDWLSEFDTFLAGTSPSVNARNIHLRNIRAVFNDAIDDEITTYYPFRKFKIRPVPTAKRSLSVEDLRKLFDYPVEPHTKKYRDIFKLIFLLIGINSVDLCRLKREDMINGRIIYNRAKTGKQYSIKVEPEALEIIERYAGRDYLLGIMDNRKNYKDFFHRMNDALKRIGKIERVGRGGKKVFTPLFPKISSYWARHTWATIAAELDIPKETIAASLGHGGNTVTDIYIRFDERKIDEANRRVIDYVLYDKR